MDFIAKKIAEYMHKLRQDRRWRNLTLSLAAVVVFGTTYALILPAITMDEETALDEAGVELIFEEGYVDVDDDDELQSADASSGSQASQDDGAALLEDTADVYADEDLTFYEIDMSDDAAQTVRELTWVDDDLFVTVQFDEEITLPEGAALRVRELTQKDEDAELLAYCLDEADYIKEENGCDTLIDPHCLVITIEDEDGMQVSPDVSAEVTVEYGTGIMLGGDEEAYVLALADGQVQALDDVEILYEDGACFGYVYQTERFDEEVVITCLMADRESEETEAETALNIEETQGAEVQTEELQTEELQIEEPQIKEPRMEELQTEIMVIETEAPERENATDEPETETAVTETEIQAEEAGTEEIRAEEDETEEVLTEEREEAETETETETESEVLTEAQSEEITEAETEEITEAQLPAQTLTAQDTADANDAVFTATVDEGVLPEGTIFSAEVIRPGTRAYREALAAVNAYIEEAQDAQSSNEVQYLVYDLTFWYAGEEIEPEGTVDMHAVIGTQESAEEVEGAVYHLKDDGSVEDLTGLVEGSENGEVVMDYSQNSFSTVIITLTDGTTKEYTALNSVATVSVTASNATYNGTQYTATLAVSATGLTPQEIRDANYTMIYRLPKGVAPPASYVEGHQLTLSDSTGAKVADYCYKKDSSGNWYVEISFDKSYVTNHNDADNVWLEFHADYRIEEEKLDDHHNLVLDFEDNVTLTIKPNEVEYTDGQTPWSDLYVYKSNGGYQSDTNSITYTVYVSTTKGTDGQVTLEDILTLDESLSVNRVQIDSVAQYSCPYSRYDEGTLTGELSSSQYTVNTDISTGKMTVVLPELSVAEGTQASKYSVTYTVYLNELTNGVSGQVNNSVTASDGELNVKGDINSTPVSYSRVSKKGSYSSDTDKVTWVLTVNSDKHDIAGQILTDAAFADLSTAAITIKNGSDTAAASDYTINSDADGKITGITFNAAEGSNQNTNTYTITYSVDSGLTWGESKKVDNTANFGDDSATGSVDIGNNNPLEKSYTDVGVMTTENGSNTLITWKAVGNIPAGGIAEGTVLADYLGYEYTYESQTDQWMTYAQISSLINRYSESLTLDAVDESTGTTTVPGSSYSMEVYDRTSGAWVAANTVTANEGTYSSHTFTAWRITFNQAVNVTGKQTLTMTYESTADTTNVADEAAYPNTLKVKEKQVTATFSKRQELVKTDGNGKTGTTTTTSDTLNWKARILYESVKDQDLITVTDTLPLGVTLSYVSLGYDTNNNHMTRSEDGTKLTGTVWVNGDGVSVTGSVTKNDAGQEVITVTVPKAAYAGFLSWDGYLWLSYTCKIDSTYWKNYKNYSESMEYTISDLTNTISMKGSDNRNYGDATQTQEYHHIPDRMSKSGSWDSTSNVASYTILLNQYGEDLSESETLEFTDTMTINTSNHNYAIALADTVRFYTAAADENGNLVKDRELSVAYTVAQNSDDYKIISTISATVPDGTPIIVEYSYAVTRPGGTKEDVNITNTARLVGRTETSSSDGGIKRNDYEEYGGSAGVDGGHNYTLIKVEEDDHAQLLSGAKFQLYKYTKGEWTAVEAPYITNDAGKLVVSQAVLTQDKVFAYNTGYYLVETEAPAGYLTDTTTKYYFYWSNSDTDTNPISYPEGFTGTAYQARDLANSSGTIYAENARSPMTSINLHKIWQKADGSEMTSGMPETATFTLYQRELKTQEEAIAAADSTVSAERVSADLLGDYYPSSYFSRESSGDLSVTISYYVSSDQYSGRDILAIVNARTGDVLGGTVTSTGQTGFFNVTFTEKQIKEFVGNTTDDWCIRWLGYDSTTKNAYGSIQSVVVTKITIMSGVSGTWTSALNSSGDTPLRTYTVRADDDGDWYTTVSDLPTYKVNADGSYTWFGYYFVEEAQPGYTTYYSQTGAAGSGTIAVINRANPSGTQTKTSVSVSKAWQYEEGNTASVRDVDKYPVRLALYQVSENNLYLKVGEVTLDGTVDELETTAWSYAWSDLVKSITPDSGSPVTYEYYLAELTETECQSWSGNVSSNSEDTITVTDGGKEYTAYKVVSSGSNAEEPAEVTVTNTTQDSSTTLRVTKEWKDSNGNTRTAPADVTGISLNLYRFTSSIEPVNDVYPREISSGSCVNLTVKGYDANNVLTFTQEYAVPANATLTYKATSDWASWSASVLSFTAEQSSAELSFDNSKAGGGEGISNAYTLCSIKIAEDTVVSIKYNTGNTTDLTEHCTYLLSDDSGNEYVQGVPSPAVEASLYQENITLTGSDWTYSIDDLPATTTDSEGNTLYYYYYFEEVNSPSGYEVSYPISAVTSNGSYTVINTSTSPTEELTSLNVVKSWASGTTQTEQIWFQVAQVSDQGATKWVINDEEGGGYRYTETQSEGTYFSIASSENWTKTLTGLLARDTSNATYSYYVVETGTIGQTTMGNYTASYTDGTTTSVEPFQVTGSSITITNTGTNTSPDTTSISVQKKWVQNGQAVTSPVNASAELTLYRKTTYATGGSTTSSTEVASEDGNYYPTHYGLDMNKDLQTVTVTFTNSNESPWGAVVIRNITNNWTNVEQQTFTTAGTYTVTFTTARLRELVGSNEWCIAFWKNDHTTLESIKVNTTNYTQGSTNTDISVYATATLGSGSSWRASWSDLPTTGKITVDGTKYDCTYTYYVAETAASYGNTTEFVVTMSGSGGTGQTSQTELAVNGSTVRAYEVSGGNIYTLTNTINQTSIILPETGGIGAKKYTYGGFLLSVAALLLYIYKKHEEEVKTETR